MSASSSPWLYRGLRFCKCEFIQYKEHIIPDPNIYLDKEKKHFMIGTIEQAKENEWVSLKQLSQYISDENKLLKFVANITMLNK